MKIIFDENFSPGLAHGFNAFELGGKRSGVEVCHFNDCDFRGMKDEDWIPKVAKMRATVVTKDFNIRRMPAQWELCEKYKVGIFFYRPPKKTDLGFWATVRVILKQWPFIKQLSRDTNKPFAYLFTPRSTKPERLPN